MPHSRRLAGCMAMSNRAGSRMDFRFCEFLRADPGAGVSPTAALTGWMITKSSLARFSNAVVVLPGEFSNAIIIFLLLFSAGFNQRQTHALCGARRTRDRARAAPLFRPCCPLGY